MKHRLKNIRPPTTPRVSTTITLTILASLLAALAGIMGNLASTTLPNATKPYLSYAWPALGIIVFLGIIVAIWQVWYASGQPANHNTSRVPALQPAIQGTGQAAALTSASLSTTPAATTTHSSQQPTQVPGVTTSSQQAGQATSSGVAPAPSFTNWTNLKAYQVAFERLLRDLKKADE
jgi:hypothetical protein